MKNIFTAALLLFAFVGFAQTTSRPTTTTTTSSTSTTKAAKLCKEWNISKTENFGEQHDPTATQRGDKLMIMADGRYRLIMNGVAEGGTWTLDQSGTMLSLTSDAKVLKKFKVLESSDSALKIDFRDADEIHNIIYYTAAPAVQSR